MPGSKTCWGFPCLGCEATARVQSTPPRTQSSGAASLPLCVTSKVSHKTEKSEETSAGPLHLAIESQLRSWGAELANIPWTEVKISSDPEIHVPASATSDGSLELIQSHLQSLAEQRLGRKVQKFSSCACGCLQVFMTLDAFQILHDATSDNHDVILLDGVPEEWAGTKEPRITSVTLLRMWVDIKRPTCRSLSQ